MTCSRILLLLAVSLLSYEYPPSTFCMCPVASLAPGAWCLASTASPPYPEFHGAHVCGVWRRGEQRWKMLSLEVQVNELLSSPPGQSKGQPSALHEACLRQLSHLRDMVPPGPRRPPPKPSGLPGKARDLIIDIHDVHLQLHGGSEPLAISHFHDEMVPVRKQPKSGSQALLT